MLFYSFYSILFFFVLFYSILLYSILFHSILIYYILFYSILIYSILFYSILLYSIVFYSIPFYSIIFYSILFYSIRFFSIHTCLQYWICRLCTSYFKQWLVYALSHLYSYTTTPAIPRPPPTIKAVENLGIFFLGFALFSSQFYINIFMINIFFSQGGFLKYFQHCFQHCFTCRPSDCTVSKDAGIESRTVATFTLAVRRSDPPKL